jgi:acyl-CoA reductase-like NAD-dependent aldehyde dehydrogenase
VRRILVPAERRAAVEGALVEALSATVVGNPEDPSVTMGPLATARQLDEATSGVAELAREARLVHGAGRRIDGVGNPAGRGWFFGTTLLSAGDGRGAGAVHEREVFGPVATLLAYDGEPGAAASLVARSAGTLVTSVYSDEREFLSGYLAGGGASTGRLYVGSERVAAQLPGSGVALPQLLHGGPGRAGGGAELGGLRGLELYLQRVALSGDRSLVERLTGAREST